VNVGGVRLCLIKTKSLRKIPKFATGVPQDVGEGIGGAEGKKNETKGLVEQERKEALQNLGRVTFSEGGGEKHGGSRASQEANPRGGGSMSSVATALLEGAMIILKKALDAGPIPMGEGKGQKIDKPIGCSLERGNSSEIGLSRYIYHKKNTRAGGP